MNRIESLALQASEHVHRMILEAESEIDSAAVACAEEAQAQETEAKLGLTFTAKWSLDKAQVEYALSFGVRHKLTAKAVLEDPNQVALPLPKVVAPDGSLFTPEAATPLAVQAREALSN